MRPLPERRLVILTEGQWDVHNAKTAIGVMRYGAGSVRRGARLDDRRPQRVGMAGAALRHPRRRHARRGDTAYRPDALLIGIAPTGGRLPAELARDDRRGVDAGLDYVFFGLHTFLADDLGSPRRRAPAPPRSPTTVACRTAWRPLSAVRTSPARR